MLKHKQKCVVCGKTFKGATLSIKQGSTPLSFSQANLYDSEVTILSFECGHLDCEAAVCYQCIPKLEQHKEGGFIFKRKHLTCPECANSFGEGGTDFLLKGWLPDVPMLKSPYGNRPYVFQMINKIRFYYMDLAIPTYRCCLCMSESVDHVLQMPHRFLDPNDLHKEYISQHTFKLCTRCYSVLRHPSIESPGLPYIIQIDQNGVLMTFTCANHAFMDLVKALNPSIKLF